MEPRSARSCKKSLVTPRTLIPRRSSSVDARCSAGGMTGRSSRSTWTPAMSGGPNRRSSSMSQVDRLSQGAPRGANLKDQRPFNDKAYVAQCVDKLYEFLIQFFEPTFKLGGGVRMEDAVLEQLRRLGYPYPLHKSMLMGIGSQPHKALAIITWVADYAKYFDSVNPLEDFFTGEDTPIGTPGPQQVEGNSTSGLLLKHCLQRGHDDTSFDEDAFLDSLVLEAVGPVQPVEEIEEELAHQHQEVQRLTALVEEKEARKKELQVDKLKIQNFEKYFKDMAAHFENKRMEVQNNEEELAALGAERAKLEEQLANVQATLREQHARHEDVPAMKQRQHRLQQDITAARSQLEALRQQHELSSLKFYNTDEKLRSEHAKLQASFRSSTTCLRRVLPRNALDDFDMRPVEDARSLQRHVASNTAAAAKVTDMLDRMEKELQGCILQNHDLCEQYTFKVEDLERELQLKQELIAKRKSYWAEQTADTRKNAHDLDKEYADICKATSDLQQQQIHDPDIKAAQEAEKRLANLQKQLADTIARQNETIAASDAALQQCTDAATATYKEMMDTIRDTHDSIVDAIEENFKLRKQ
ncbi:uncharacterized protein LOC119172153 isoform X2 [Rhipicephalus microplus]|uniref:uncharacterized protein LOC119172153 isoform X2 n=1 Tax=Rhipicephalus microplus TaxID=6941 RepID=UPI003F6C8E30